MSRLRTGAVVILALLGERAALGQTASVAPAAPAPFAGDFGYPFHDGRRATGATYLTHVTDVLVDSVVGYERRTDVTQSPDAKTKIVTSGDQADVVAAERLGGGPVVGLGLEGQSRHGTNAFTADQNDGASTYAFTRRLAGAALLAATPLAFGLSAAAKATYYWVDDTLDARQAEVFGQKTGDKVAFPEFEPSLLYTGRDFEVALAYTPEISKLNGILEIRSPAALSLTYLSRVTPQATLVAGLGWSYWSETGPGLHDAPSLLFGERQALVHGAGELGAFVRYDFAHDSEATAATPDTIAKLSIDLAATWHATPAGDLAAVVEYLSGHTVKNGPDIGTVTLDSQDYAMQLAWTQRL